MNQNANATAKSVPLPDRSNPDFNIIALGFSTFLFLATFSYWFVGQSSSASLINVLIGKADVRNAIAEDNYQVTWVPFYLHLFVTALGLIIYSNSGFTKWIAATLSQQFYVQSYFQSDYKLATNILKSIQAIFAAILIFNLYDLTMGMVAGESLPLGNVRILILVFFLFTSIWTVGKIEAQEYPHYTGVLNSKSKRLWFRLSAKQFAFVQDLENLNSWQLYKDNAYIDLSFRECYLFFPETFNIIITDSMLSKDLIGSVKYSVRSDINTKNLSDTLTTSQLINLNTKFTSKTEFDRLVYVLLDHEDLIEQAKTDIFTTGQEYFNINQSIFSNNSTKNQEDLRKILNSRTDFKPIERKIEEKITEEASELIGTSGLLKISFKITESEFKMDDMLKNIIDSKRKTFDQVEIGNLEAQKKVLDTLLTTTLTPGISQKKLETLLTMADRISNPTLSPANNEALREAQEPKLIESPIKVASANMVSAIFEIMDKEPTQDEIAEAISKSTNFIGDNGIPVADFVQKFFTKLNTERDARSIEAYEKLAEDTLTELIEKKR